MTVLHRVKRSPGPGIGRRSRGEREPAARLRGRAAARLAEVAAAEPAVAQAQPPEPAVTNDTLPVPAARRGPATQDRALYSCACGFVFDHEVSTSVACPHCGGAQAW